LIVGRALLGEYFHSSGIGLDHKLVTNSRRKMRFQVQRRIENKANSCSGSRRWNLR
jgi:hypothetical protein